MDEDFLAGVFAVQLGYAKPAQVMAAASAWLADRSLGIVDRLEAEGTLDQTKRELLRSFVTEALKAHDGDVQKTLHSIGGDQALFRSFGGSVVVNEQGGLTAQEAAAADKVPEAMGESTTVTLEQPGRYAPKGGSVDTAEIGRGGLGRILVAMDEHLGREVAIKELLAGAEGSEATPGTDGMSRPTAMAARFLREARVTGQLEHPNIVPVHEVGQRQDGTYYYAMRVVRGRTLGKELKGCAGLDERLALLRHYIDLCNAIAYAHSRGVVHRDIKPDNVMIGEFGETVVLDWGLAKVRGKTDIRGRDIEREVKLLQEAAAGHTVEGSAVGTPAYMSPEQAEGDIEQIDERSDVWGLGAVLYEVLTGKPPYEGTTPFEILGKVLKDPVAPVRSRSEEAPAELAAVAEKALTHDRAQRYPSAKELAKEVDAYLQGRRVSAYAYSSWELLRRFIAANKALSLAAAGAVVILLVSSVLIWQAYRRADHARWVAEQQKKHAFEQEGEARVNLAQAYVASAEQLLRERNYGAAYVHAAAALRTYQGTQRPLSDDQRAALESVLYEAKVWRALRLERTVPGAEGTIYDVAFSPDGKLLATLGEELWLHHVDGSKPPVKRDMSLIGTHLRFSDDGKTVRVGHGDGVLRTYRQSDLEELGAEPFRTEAAAQVALSPDGSRILVAEADRKLVLLSRAAPEQEVVLGPTRGMSWSSDGTRIARCTRAGTVVLHDGVTGAELATIQVFDKWVTGCVFSPDGKRLFTRTDEAQAIVDLSTQKVTATLRGQRTVTTSYAGSPNGHWWVLGHSAGAYLWDGRTEQPTEILWRSTKPSSVAFSPSGKGVAVVEPGAVRLWQWRTSERAVTVPANGICIRSAFSPDGRHAAFSDSHGTVQFVDLAAGFKASLLTQHPTSYGTDVAFSPDGKRIATVGHDQVVNIFDATERQLLRSRTLTRLQWDLSRSSSLAYAPDGARLFVTAPDGRVHVLAESTLDTERVLAADLAWPPSLAVAADGSTLLAGDVFGQIGHWELDGLRLVRVIQSGTGYISDLLLTADGQTIVTASKDGWLRRYSRQTGKLVQGKQAHDTWVNQLALSPDGALLLSGSDDQTARLWDAATGTLLRTMQVHQQAAAVAFSPDGKRFAVGGEGGQVYFPNLRDLSLADGHDLLEEARRVTGRKLVGFAVEPMERQAPKDETPVADAGAPPPDEVRGQVRDFFSPNKPVPEGTTVELLDAERHEPLSPPLVARTDTGGHFTLRLPDGVNRYAARITAGTNVTLARHRFYRRGKTEQGFTLVPLDQMASIARSVGVELHPDKGHVFGMAWWFPDLDGEVGEPVGCVELTAPGAKRAYYAAPRPDSRAHPDPTLDRNHPGAAFYYLFNVEPGLAQVVARLGEHRVETKVRTQAGAVSYGSVYFHGAAFPTNPTPSDCLLDWPPAADAGD